MEKDKHSSKINLEEMEKKNIHLVPDGYFDKLPYSIQEKISAKQKLWFETLKLSPAKYALSGLAIIILTVFVYLIVPKNQELISQNKTTEIKKDTVVNSPDKNNQKKNNSVIPPAPSNNNSIVIEQKKNNQNSIENNKNMPVVDEKLSSPESYLAELTKDDIQEFLELNELDQLQPDDSITD